MVDVGLKDCAKINAVYIKTVSKLIHSKLEYIVPADFVRYVLRPRLHC